MEARKKKKKEKGRKEKKNITRVEFAKIYDAGSFAKVARGDTNRSNEVGARLTNGSKLPIIPGRFVEALLLIKSAATGFSLKSSVNVRS